MRTTLIVLLAGAVFAFGASAEPPYRIQPNLSLRTGNWFPLEPDEMKSAAGDAALAELSSLGLLALAGPGETVDGRLDLEVSLVGTAETAKLSMTLKLTGQPTYASTASISVAGLDENRAEPLMKEVQSVVSRNLERGC